MTKKQKMCGYCCRVTDSMGGKLVFKKCSYPGCTTGYACERCFDRIEERLVDTFESWAHNKDLKYEEEQDDYY